MLLNNICPYKMNLITNVRNITDNLNASHTNVINRTNNLNKCHTKSQIGLIIWTLKKKPSPPECQTVSTLGSHFIPTIAHKTVVPVFCIMIYYGEYWALVNKHMNPVICIIVQYAEHFDHWQNKAGNSLHKVHTCIVNMQ